MRIIVFHDYYGCETGCCGHRIDVSGTAEEEDNLEWKRSRFDFDHSGSTDEAKIKFARDLITETLGEEHVKDLDWENCVIMSWGEG